MLREHSDAAFHIDTVPSTNLTPPSILLLISALCANEDYIFLIPCMGGFIMTGSNMPLQQSAKDYSAAME